MMQPQMSKILLQGLSPDAIDVLRRHNLLRSLITAQIIEEAVSGTTIESEQCTRVWQEYLKNQIKDESSLEKHLVIIGLDHNALRWQLELLSESLSTA